MANSVIEELLQCTSDSQFHCILLNPKPDAGFEYFWYLHKNGFINFSYSHPDNKPLALLVATIPDITEDLNARQKEAEMTSSVDDQKAIYRSIAVSIEHFLVQYYHSILAYCEYNSEYRYNIAIAQTSYKRWQLCSTFQLNENGMKIGVEHSVDYQFMVLLIDIINQAEKQEPVFNLIKKGFKYGIDNRKPILMDLIDVAITSRRGGFLSKIATYDSDMLHQYVAEKYNCNLPCLLYTSPSPRDS